jgi:hypothetical protein
MVRNIGLFCFVLLMHFGYSQNTENVTAKRPLKFNLGLSQSSMINYSNQNLYFDGSLEYYASENVSFKGNCLWFIDSRNTDPIIKQNSVILFGSAYHFVKKNHDISLGFQPGFTYAAPEFRSEHPQVMIFEQNYPARVTPVVGFNVGYTYYFAKYCNFFVNAQYLFSRYRGALGGSINLDELMFSGGLGFQLFTRKKVL